MLWAVRRTAVVLAFALAWPAAAGAQEPTLTLKAPKATSYGHRIEFVGRLTPAVPEGRIALFRGKDFVAAGTARRDGTFRIPVRLARPGPFRVGWAGVFSSSVTVRIHPRLQARLIGARVVGLPLRLVARVQPSEAGAIRVQIFRGGRQHFDSRFLRGEARVALGTPDLGTIRVRVTTVPRPGYHQQAEELRAALRPPRLAVGMTSPAVAAITRQLAALNYAVPAIPSTFTTDFLQSVYAFQKVNRLPRTGVVDATFWSRLQTASIPRPRYRQPADHIEVDKTRQVLFVVRGGEVALVSPVSTAGIPGYYTPEGRFAIYRKVAGYDPSPLGVLLNPMYFTGGYAIHGNPSVPPYPASHGCVRVPNFVIFRLFASEPYGETVYVYS